MSGLTYEQAGVGIERGDRFASFIAGIRSSAVGALGGFSGGVELDPSRWSKPVLLTTTDGVGTKLLVARQLDRYDTIGIDLVAMCVNDLAVCGADPLLFLDYIACGVVDEPRLQAVMRGIVAGCELAGCTLAGGETAEMPDMYGPDDIDLAGFAVGLVEQSERLPRIHDIREGDVLVGLASSGIHSNGFSLARKACTGAPEELWWALLEPTRIYTSQLSAIRGLIKAAAHVTGGGLVGNLERVLPDGLRPQIEWDWPVPAVFTEIAGRGAVDPGEMRRVFNMGVGVVMVASPSSVDAIAKAAGEPLIRIGHLRRG